LCRFECPGPRQANGAYNRDRTAPFHRRILVSGASRSRLLGLARVDLVTRSAKQSS
jgi:hypothetical protein